MVMERRRNNKIYGSVVRFMPQPWINLWYGGTMIGSADDYGRETERGGKIDYGNYQNGDVRDFYDAQDNGWNPSHGRFHGHGRVLSFPGHGRDFYDHPMIAHLVEMQNLLDKIWPFDIKLKNQIERILKEDKIDLIKRALEKYVMNPISVVCVWSKLKPDETIQGYEDKGESLKCSKTKVDNMKVLSNGGKEVKETDGAESKEMFKERSLSRIQG
ncbi:hypothetical protein KI387_022519, partial [Taxus chinensis]